MESAEAPLRYEYIVHTFVDRIEEHFEDYYISGVGANAKFKRMSKGWFMLLAGSHEAIYVGETCPDFKVGGSIEIVFRRPK